MARPKTIPFRETLRKLFPAALLLTLARETGAVLRRRKVDIVCLFWTVILGSGRGRGRTLTGMRCEYEKVTRQTLSSSAFQKRFTAGFVRFLKRAVSVAFGQVKGLNRPLEGPLAAFHDVLLTDGTVIRLHDLLEKSFPGSRTNHSKAALKYHPVMSIRGEGEQSVRITSGRRNDGPVLKIGRWVKDRLLIFDLAYFRYHLFACITRNKGFFLSRLKSSANPTIVGENRPHRGRGASLVGQCLRDVLGTLTGQILDVRVKVAFSRRLYKGGTRRDRQTLRVVGLHDEATGEYHLYMTNVPPDKLAAEDVGPVYACRWLVEQMFRRLKSHYRLEDMPSRKKETVEALVYCAILTMLVADELLHAVRLKLAVVDERLKRMRWAALFERFAGELLLIVTQPRRAVRFLERMIAHMVVAEAPDPNLQRAGLLRAVEKRTYKYRSNSL